MKFILITVALANPMVYPDQATCEVAVNQLNSVEYYDAVCIPQGEAQPDPSDKMFSNFLGMTEKLHKMHSEPTKVSN